ncbi:MAG TPA: hypothetical protein VFO69_07765 [Allosphingosinicella sp.]|nr:hypothetical protein [Allosphingosinicella sp.]
MTDPFFRLTQLNHKLAQAIDAESRRPLPNPIKLLRMKSLRLAIKLRLLRFQRDALRV